MLNLCIALSCLHRFFFWEENVIIMWYCDNRDIQCEIAISQCHFVQFKISVILLQPWRYSVCTSCFHIGLSNCLILISLYVTSLSLSLSCYNGLDGTGIRWSIQDIVADLLLSGSMYIYFIYLKQFCNCSTF